MSDHDHDSDSDDEAFLDEFFELAVRARATGAPLELEERLHDHAHLRDRAAALLELAREVAVTTDPDTTDAALPEIAGYTIQAELGRGGMGIVYRARQESLARTVALKVLAPALVASARSRERFATEARALGRLRHPHIVTVHEVIVRTELCAYSMEWIDGATLATAIAARDPRLSVTAVAQLGVQLARALEVVHAAGLVHRDVKPGNVLLRADGSPVLSDFSLVHDAENSLHTATGEFLGTAAFAAPEQLRGEHDAVGPWTDVYALAVTLYCALAGKSPFADASTGEVLRRIESGDATPLGRATAHVPRDLSTVIAKAMDRDPAGRYRSAADFADDLERFLGYEPVLARPASLVLRWQRWLERSPQLALALAGLLLALLLGLGAAIYLSIDLATQRDVARFAEQRSAEESAIQKEVVAFMRSVFRSGDATLIDGRADMTVREAVEQASRKLLDQKTPHRPEVEHAVRVAIGELLASIGAIEMAETHSAVAVTLGREVYGPDSIELAEALQYLARSQRQGNRFAEAEASLRECVRVRRARHAAGDKFGAVNLAQSLNSLGLVLRAQRRFADAEACHLESLALYRKAVGDANENVAVVLGSIALLQSETGRFAEAERNGALGLEILLRIHGERPHLDVGQARFNLGGVVLRQGRREEGLALMRSGHAMNTALVGETHVLSAGEAWALGKAERDAGNIAEAERLFRQALAAQRELRNAGRAQLVALDLAALWSDAGRHAEAEAELLRVWSALDERDAAATERRDAAAALARLHEAWEQREPGAGHAAQSSHWQGLRDEAERATTGR
ncbi:MAG: serine/threonine protein kinase [Planctomycetes bacterium]|nr:serine/threonine protein kinase [Planctomycetota bacterium]